MTPKKKPSRLFYWTERRGWYYISPKGRLHRMTRGPKTAETKDEALAAVTELNATGKPPIFERPNKGYCYQTKKKGWFLTDEPRSRLTYGPRTPESEGFAKLQYDRFRTGKPLDKSSFPNRAKKTREIPVGVRPETIRPDSSLWDVMAVYRDRKLVSAVHSTISQFCYSLNKLERAIGREPTLQDLTDENVESAMWAVVKGGGAPATANKCRTNLVALWSFACKRGWRTVWPDVKAIREPKRVPQAWTRDQLRALFNALSKQQGSIDGVPAALWWQTLHSVLWDGGTRITETLALKWCNMNLETGWVRIPAEDRKFKLADHQFMLHSDTVRMLRVIQEPLRELVFPFPYHRSLLWQRYHKILKTAGLPCDSKHKFHAMRKSAASYLEAVGGDATEMLAHGDRSITVKHYIDSTLLPKRHASTMLFRPDSLEVQP